jgi:hypothetical protein
MTSSPQPNHVSPLKVVPPGAKRPTPIESTESAEPADRAESPADSSERSVSKRTAFFVVVALLAGLGFVPLPTYVTGRAEVDLRDDNRQSVSMREAGRVELRVKPRAAVRRGDVVAIIENDELTSQILEQERLVMDTQAAIFAAERRLAVAQAVAVKSRVENHSDQLLLERQTTKLGKIEAGIGTSETQQLASEIDAIRSQAARQTHDYDRLSIERLELTERQTKIQEQLTLLNARREELTSHLAELESLADDGGLAYQGQLLRSLRADKSDLDLRVSNTESELQSITRQIEQRYTQQDGIEREIERFGAQERVIAAQIEGAIGEVEEDGIRDQGEWESSRAEFDRSAEDINLALVELERQEQLAIAHQEILQQLQARREALHLRASVDGIVITEDLDLKDGKWFNQGESLFAIAPSEVYDIAARLNQGDTELFNEGDRATFYNDTPGMPPVTGRVKVIDPVLDDEETTGDKAELEVTIEPDQVDNHPTLRQKVKGYVKIHSPKKLNAYQSIGHQIGKVVNIKRYPPFIWFN